MERQFHAAHVVTHCTSIVQWKPPLVSSGAVFHAPTTVCYNPDMDKGKCDPMEASTMRDTNYATELVEPAKCNFPDGSEGRIERLRFKGPLAAGEEGYRFSWWKDGNMTPRPLDATEDQMLELLGNAISEGVLTERFVARLRAMLP
jgi:hypothetical protein